jgi:hypothetical protein
MQKVQLKPYVEADVLNRFTEIAAHYSMSAPALAATIITEISRVPKEGLFEALAAIPAELKTRPVGRPAGSGKVPQKTEAVA